MPGYWENRYRECLSSGRNYDAYDSWDRDAYADETAKLKAEVSVLTGGRRFGLVLDYGCGRGRFSDMWECYLGVDIIPELIYENKKAYPLKRWHVLDPGHAPSADLIFCCTVLQYVKADDIAPLLRRFSGAAGNLIVIESVGPANPAITFRHDLDALFPACGWKTKAKRAFSSREDYVLMWAVRGAEA